MKIKEVLQKAKEKLKGHSSSPSLDTEILLAKILDKSREFILSFPEKKISPEKTKSFWKLLERRIRQEPIAHLIGEKNFYGQTFKVTPDTLIPRPETELLVEKTLEYIHKEILPSKKTLLVDVGTGSGCILISILKELQKNKRFSDFKAVGTDISKEALKIAGKNRQNLLPEKKIDFLESNLIDFLTKRYLPAGRQVLEYLKGSQIVICANLPYLSENIYEKSPKTVTQFEPEKALLAKNEGLEFYIKILEEIKEKNLEKIAWNIYLIFEISPEQKTLAQKKFKEIFPDLKMKFSKDLAQKWRFVEIFF